MLKYVLLAGAMTISAPAFAQEKATDSTTAPTTQVAPTSATSTIVDPAAPQSVTPADPAATSPAATPNSTPAQDSQAAAQQPQTDPTAQPAQTASTAPVSGPEQIAQVVNAEFSSYDKDKNGTLDESEFGAWMVALKEKSDPSTKPDSPATKAWVDQAFASADKDKSKSLTKPELTSFLSQGA